MAQIDVKVGHYTNYLISFEMSAGERVHIWWANLQGRIKSHGGWQR